jgi:hypothetical protein
MSRAVRIALVVVAALVAGFGAFPAAAAAHGPANPLASSYLARATAVPRGIEAKTVDGDQRMWLRVSPSRSVVVVLDYRGAPYLRFSPAGVAVNRNSGMYYLNQTPVAQTPPAGLTRNAPPDWRPVTGAHQYAWHDGRLHALAAVALSPGAAYVGRWTIPLRVDGRPGAISGGLWHRGAPSLVWFWPMIVLLLCLPAAWRVRRPSLDALVARALAGAVLMAIAVASLGRNLHGRPAVSAFGVVELGVILALVGWALVRVLRHRAGFLTYFAIAFVAVWEGITLLAALFHGYVLMALPAFLARTATVACLGGGAGLVLVAFRLASEAGGSDEVEDEDHREPVDGEDGTLAESLA